MVCHNLRSLASGTFFWQCAAGLRSVSSKNFLDREILKTGFEPGIFAWEYRALNTEQRPLIVPKEKTLPYYTIHIVLPVVMRIISSTLKMLDIHLAQTSGRKALLWQSTLEAGEALEG